MNIIVILLAVVGTIVLLPFIIRAAFGLVIGLFVAVLIALLFLCALPILLIVGITLLLVLGAVGIKKIMGIK